MRVRDLDGRTWRVGRRWLPWRRRIRDAPDADMTGIAEHGDDLPSFFVLLLIGLAASFIVPILLLVIGIVLELALLFVLFPVVVLIRVTLRRPWVVQVIGPDGKVSRVEKVVGWRESGDRIASLAIELREHSTGLPSEPGSPSSRDDRFASPKWRRLFRQR
jgi:hypothetical protein